MIQNPGFLMYVLAFALVIGPLIFLHELGHYWAGRWMGVKADAFSIGFGPEIAGWTDRRGTRWKLSVLPLGGYVKFAGDMNPASTPDLAWLSLPAEERSRTFQAKKLWQRAIIVAAGPVTNLVIAVAILTVFAATYGVDRTPPVVSTVEPNSAAARAGILPGDRILMLGGRAMETYSDLAAFTQLRPGETVGVDVLRQGKPTHLRATLGAVSQKDRFGNVTRLGQLGIRNTHPVFAPAGVLEAPVIGVKQAVAAVQGTLDGLGQIITGRRSVEDLHGPVGMAKMSGEFFTLGWPALVWLIAMVSINLGFINLLPLPVLDGGHLFFYALEAIRRRPLGPKVQEWAFGGGLVAILLLMLIVTVNDLGALGLWKPLSGLIG